MSKASEMELVDGTPRNFPEHLDEQLEIAGEITHFAVSGPVASLEAELDCLTQKLVRKAAVAESLQARITTTESMLGETTAKLAIALQEQAKLAKDEDVLADRVKNLTCQVSLLNDFKKAMTKSSGSNSDCGGDPSDATYSYSPKVSASTPCSSGELRLQMPLIMSKRTESPAPTKRMQQGQYSCMMLIPEDSPRDSAKSDASGAFSEKSRWESSLTPLVPSNTCSGKPYRIHGKEILRRARARLTYEQFSDFLNNIKEVNALRRAEKAHILSTGVFHPNIHSCKTRSPPSSGDWVIMSGIR